MSNSESVKVSKATPGPWRTEFNHVIGIDGQTVAVCDHSGTISSQERRANTHLIASAPDMYEALKRARVALCSVVDSSSAIQRTRDTAIEQIHAALSKAGGDQK